MLQDRKESLRFLTGDFSPFIPTGSWDFIIMVYDMSDEKYNACARNYEVQKQTHKIILYTCAWCIDAYKRREQKTIPYWEQDSMTIHYDSIVHESECMEISHGICDMHLQKEIEKLRSRRK